MAHRRSLQQSEADGGYRFPLFEPCLHYFTMQMRLTVGLPLTQVLLFVISKQLQKSHLCLLCEVSQQSPCPQTPSSIVLHHLGVISLHV